MPPSPRPELVRAIGRWSLTGLVINCVIGSGIFGLPDDVARLVGGRALWAYAIAAAGSAVLMAVFAEVGSQFRDAGGPYLWAREAFGRFAAIQTGWFMWVVRLTSAAAIVSLLVVYLGEFWPRATQPLVRVALLVAIVGAVAAANVRGVAQGALLSTVFAAAKLLVLGLFIVAGLWLLPADIAPATVQPGSAGLAAAVLALMFAFGGFEAALIPIAEARDPRRDIPFAMFAGLATVATIYVLVHVVSMRALPDLASTDRPVTEAARVFLGDSGALVVAVGVVVCIFGAVCAQAVTAPRLAFALADRGDIPAYFGAVHPRLRTPHRAILFWAVPVLLLAIYGDFYWNAILSVSARLLTYGVACAALLRLRHARPAVEAFRLPAGPLFAVTGFGFCAVLLSQMDARHAVIAAVVAFAAGINWLIVRRRT